jgi:hypothetical protein
MYLINYEEWKRVYETLSSAKMSASQAMLTRSGLTQQNLRANLSMDFESTIDIIIDVIAGILDGIPIVGTGVSTALDLLHTVSYAIRFYFSEEGPKKSEYAALSIINLFSTAVPLGGNASNIAARLGIKEILSISPKAIAKVLSPAYRASPLRHWTSHVKWKFDALWILVRIVGGEIADLFVKAVNAVKTAGQKLEAYLKEWVDDLMVGWLVKDAIAAVKSIAALLTEMSQMVSAMVPLAAEIRK